MPNWCQNRLRVTGEQSEIDAFAAAAAGEDPDRPLSFQALRPVPPELLEAEGDGVRPSQDTMAEILGLAAPTTAYTWRLQNWGTKRESFFGQLVSGHPSVLRRAEELVYFFDTANSPPAALVSFVAARFPKLRFELLYAEPGNDLAGRLVCEDGTEDDQELDVDAVSDELWV